MKNDDTSYETSALKVSLHCPDDATHERLKDLRNKSHRYLNKTMLFLLTAETGNGEKPLATRAYQFLKKEAEEAKIPGAMTSSYAQFAYQRYRTDCKAILRGDQRIPYWRYPSPILIRGDNWRLNPDTMTIKVKLDAGRGAWHSLSVRMPRNAKKYIGAWKEQIEYAKEHPELLGDLKIVWSKRKSRWMGIIAVNREVEKRAPERVLGVHFGMTVPIQTAMEDGKKVWRIGSARELWAFRAQMKDRKRRLGRRSRGRQGQFKGGGKGWRRRNRSLHRLRDAEDRWIKTKCQQYAAQVIQAAKKFRCGTLALGSYDEHKNPVSAARETDKDDREWVEEQVLFWQPYRLRETIAWAARREGFRYVLVEEAHQSRTCAQCGHEDADNRVSRSLFRCGSCGHEGDAEINAARNLAACAETVES